jgi:hypothetical protein
LLINKALGENRGERGGGVKDFWIFFDSGYFKMFDNPAFVF